MKKYIIIYLLTLFSINITKAKIAKSTSTALSQSSISASAKFMCFIPQINTLLGTSAPGGNGYWDAPTGTNLDLIKNKLASFDILKSTARIVLRVKDQGKLAEANLCLPNNFTYNLTVSYKKMNTAGDYDVNPSIINLTVTYDKSKGLTYKSMDVFQIENVSLISCFIVSGSWPNSVDPRNFLEVGAEIEYEYLVKESFLNSVGGLYQGIYYLTPELYVVPANNSFNLRAWINPIYNYGYQSLISDFTNWIDSVEFQWTVSDTNFFKYNSSLNKVEIKKITTLTTDFQPDFNNYVLSVVVPYSSSPNYQYVLSNIFESGVISFRARFSGKLAIKDDNNTIIGQKNIQLPWSDYSGQTLINNGNSTASNATGYSLSFLIDTYKPNFNWIYSCTYAEDGKKKESINYFDGTLKSRQQISTSNTDNFALVKETIYDYQGRPAIEVLPVPVNTSSLDYIPNFNQVVGTNTKYSAENFDLNIAGANCVPITMAMSNNSGAAKYYSPNNTWLASTTLNSKHQFIPTSGDATNGFFPFVQTVYTPDNTGRVSLTTQPGLIFKRGNNRETRYIYGRPEQEELDRLFGTEIGFAEHYTKETVKDANGQYSISVKDLSGKVVFTALAGGNTAQTSQLVTDTNALVVDVDLLKHSQSKIDDGYLLTSPITVFKNDNFLFQYSLDPVSYSKLCGSTTYCLDCIYDMELSITNECGEEQLFGDPSNPTLKAPIVKKIGPLSNDETNNKVCNPADAGYDSKLDNRLASMNLTTSILGTAANNASNKFITVNLNEGKYFITRKIKVNNEAREYYLREVVAKTVCKTLAQFEAEEAAKIDLEQCKPCQDYNNVKKTGGDTRAKYVAAIYKKRITDKGFILDQVAADKKILQYGVEYDSLIRYCGIQFDPCVTYKNVIMQDVSPNGLYGELTPRNSTNTRFSVFRTLIGGNEYYKTLVAFANIDFTNLKTKANIPTYWKPEYAEKLMPLHPEYYQYKACLDLSESRVFDVEMASVTDYDVAKNWNYMDLIGTSASNNKDKFFVTTKPLLLAATARTNFQSDVNKSVFPALKITNLNGITALSLKEFTAYVAFCKTNAANNGNLANQTLIRTCINSTLSNINNCDYRAKSLFWTTYKGLYNAIKTIRYDNYIQSVKSQSYPTNTFIVSAGNVMYGTTFTNLDNNNIRFPALEPTSNLLNTVTAKNITETNNQIANCKNNCERMADAWIQKLNACFFSGSTNIETQKQILKTALINVCQEGCDEKNPMGASSVKPGSFNSDKSFEDVMIRLGYPYSKDCNAGLIKFPKPYDAKGNASDSKNNPLLNKTNLCDEGTSECIFMGYYDWNDVKLQSACYQNNYNGFKETELELLLKRFDTLNCESGNCFSCAKFAKFYEEYYNSPDEFTSNVSFENFMNNKTGFNLSKNEYENFMRTCVVGYDAVELGSQHGYGTFDPYPEFRKLFLIYKKTPTSYTFAKLDNKHFDLLNKKLYLELAVPQFLPNEQANKYSSDFNQPTASLTDTKTYLNKRDLGFGLKTKDTKSTGNLYLPAPLDCNNIRDYIGQFLGKFQQNLTTIDFDGIYFNPTDFAVYLVKNGYVVVPSVINPSQSSNWAEVMLSQDIRTLLCNCNLVSTTFCNSLPFSSSNNLGCSNILTDLNVSFPNNQYINVIRNTNELDYTINHQKLVDFYNLVQTKTYKNNFIQLSPSQVTHENLKLWLGDILCKCGISDVFCATEMRRCKPVKRSSDDGCHMPGPKVLALQSLFQEIVKTGGFNCSNSITANVSGRLEGTSKCLPINCTDLLSLFNISKSDDPSFFTSELKYSPTSYKVGSTKLVVANLMLSNVSLNPWHSPAITKDFYCTVGLSMIVDDSRINFENIIEIEELRPATYGTPAGAFLNMFTLKAKAVYNVNGKLQVKSILVKGYYYFEGVPFYYQDVNLYTSYNCRGLRLKLCKKPEVAIEPCEQTLQNTAKAIAFYKYNQYLTNVLEEEKINYTNKCLDALKTSEKLRKVYRDQQYHYTLYYYDAAGNLLKTVPPQDVKFIEKANLINYQTVRLLDYNNYINSTNITTTIKTPNPIHYKATYYKYNTLNQLVWQQTPDAGESNFAYDALGRLSVSQNAKQKAKKTSTTLGAHSYTLYDKIGRIIEVGELPTGVFVSDPFTNSAGFETFGAVAYTSTNKSQITRTFYDYNPDILDPTINNNSRGRVAKVAYYETYPTATTKPSHSITYDYDIRGNVKQIKRFMLNLEVLNQAEKTVDYDFDVISGKVENVYYQNNKADQYIHHYKYDAENRLIESYSSPRNELINKSYVSNTDPLNKLGLDASYNYYFHGPLSRTELGELKVQGLDYAYTLQGWLKGVNSNNLKPDFDMGKDNYKQGTIDYSAMPKDEMGFVLNYYKTDGFNDYDQIQQTSGNLVTNNKFNGILPNSSTISYNTYARSLYNGNINSMITAIGVLLNTTNNNGLVSAYQYDQLNRIKEAKYFTQNADGTSLTATTNWNNILTYDADGNIVKQFRNGTSAMDNLTYCYKGYWKSSQTATTEAKFHYGYNANGAITILGGSTPASNFVRYTNQLDYVADAQTNANAYTDDIDNQTIDNYGYDQIGNLIRDNKEGITNIEWNLYGKIKRITRTGKPTIEFEYTPDGHRAVKIVYGTPTIYTYYVRDAQGNIMATYDRRFEKIINYEALTFTQINNKIIEKTSNNSFGQFIGTMHHNQNNLLNGLRAQITTPADENIYINNLGVTGFLGAEVNVETAINVFNSYEAWQILQAAKLYWQFSNGYLLARQLRIRNNLNPAMQDLQNIIVQNPDLLRAWIYQLYAYDLESYQKFMVDLGLTYDNDFNSDFSNVLSKASIDILTSLQNNIRFYNIEEEGSKSNLILNRLLINDIDFRNQLFAIIPDFLGLFLQTDNFEVVDFSTFRLNTINMSESLSAFNNSLLIEKTKVICGSANLINWYVNTNQRNFCNLAASLNPAYISTYQTTNQAVLYPTESGVNNSNKKVYFTRIKDYFGQSLHDILLNEFLPTTDLSSDKLTVSEFHIYGSSRLGVYHADMLVANRTVTTAGVSTPMSDVTLSANSYTQIRGAKNYEMSNHLGNVLVTVSDKKIYNCKKPELINYYTDYICAYPINSASNVNGSSGKLFIKGNGLIGIDGAFLQKSVIGKTYRVTYDITINGPLSVALNIYSRPTATGGLGSLVNSTTQTTSGTKTYTFVANSEVVSFRFQANHTSGLAPNGFSVGGFIVAEESANTYEADVVSAQDYSPFGAPLAGRTFQAENAVTTNSIYQSNFNSGNDGWIAFPGATFANYFGSLRVTTVASTTATKGVYRTFLTEAGKLYRIKIRNHYGALSKITVESWVNTYKLIATYDNLVGPGETYYTFRAISNQTDIRVFDPSSNTASTNFTICNFVLEEVEEKNTYRFGFNGQEKDDEISGAGNTMTAEFWEYDARLGRRWNLDPVTIVGESEYSTFANNPIFSSDPDGDEVPKRLNLWQRTKNAIKGEEYKNSANKFAVKNKIDESQIKTDKDGNIVMNYGRVTQNYGIVELEQIKVNFNQDGSSSQVLYNSSNNWRGAYNLRFGSEDRVITGDAPDVGLKGINTVYKAFKYSLPYIGKAFNILKRYTKDERRLMEVTPVLNKINDKKLLRAVEQRVIEFMKRNGPTANDRNAFNPKRKDYKEWMKKADDWLEKNAPDWKEKFKEN